MKYLVIVDMQNDFITGALGTPEAVTARNSLVQKLKEEDEDTIIIFTQDTHSDRFYLDTLEGKNLPIKHCILQTEGWFIDDEIFHLGTFERVYDVVTKSAFGAEDLPKTIMNFAFDNEAPTIEICGLCTDICVISNALILRAAMPNVTIRLDSSCCAGTTPAAHEAALTVMRSCQIEVY